MREVSCLHMQRVNDAKTMRCVSDDMRLRAFSVIQSCRKRQCTPTPSSRNSDVASLKSHSKSTYTFCDSQKAHIL